MNVQTAIALDAIHHHDNLRTDVSQTFHPPPENKNDKIPVPENEKRNKVAIPPHSVDLLPHQLEVYNFYASNTVQFIVAGLIFSNFFVASINSQLRPEKNSLLEDIFFGFEIAFAVVFTIELCINWYGSWFWHFWKSGWNWFDFIIVIISLLAIFIANLPGISVLRLFRAFRVFRLFKRIPSLKHITEGVFASLPDVANAFSVLTILMGIWSIMGVEFFRKVSSQEFGTFMKSMFTMWQIMSMDSWASGIARKIIYKDHITVAAVYFISYLFVNGIVMTNVIIAILLENYLNATSSCGDMEEEEEEEEEIKTRQSAVGERLEDITKTKLIELVGDVLVAEQIERFERKEINELFYALYSHQSCQNEIKTKLAAYRQNLKKTKNVKEKIPNNKKKQNHGQCETNRDTSIPP